VVVVEKRKFLSSVITLATLITRRRRKSSRRAHITIISSRGRYGMPTLTRRHSVKTTSSMHEKSHRTSMAVIQHHCKTTIFIGLMVKVGII
jgi:hypothetical protein